MIDCDFREVRLYVAQTTFDGDGGGILFISQRGRESDSSDVIEIEASRFIANHGGLDVNIGGRSSKLVIRNNWFLSNTSGAGISTGSGSTAEIHNNYFIGNRFGIHLAGWEEGLIVIEGSVVSGNSDAGLYVRSESRIEARNNLIEDNGWGVYVTNAKGILWFDGNRVLRNREWGVALWRFPCVENPPPQDPRVLWLSQIFIQGENNEIRDNGKGDLCPEDYNWPPNFRKP